MTANEGPIKRVNIASIRKDDDRFIEVDILIVPELDPSRGWISIQEYHASRNAYGRGIVIPDNPDTVAALVKALQYAGKIK